MKKKKAGEMAVIAYVIYKTDKSHLGYIVALQLKKYWPWIPFGYYFKLGFLSKETHATPIWYSGDEEGENKLRRDILQKYPHSKIVLKQKEDDFEFTLNALENTINKLN